MGCNRGRRRRLQHGLWGKGLGRRASWRVFSLGWFRPTAARSPARGGASFPLCQTHLHCSGWRPSSVAQHWCHVPQAPCLFGPRALAASVPRKTRSSPQGTFFFFPLREGWIFFFFFLFFPEGYDEAPVLNGILALATVGFVKASFIGFPTPPPLSPVLIHN